MVKLNTHDLSFILDQIRIAEAHNALIAGFTPDDYAEDDPVGDALRTLVDSPLLPHGLRTVDGSYNNLVPGREQWGMSGEPFPRLTDEHWVSESDDSISFGNGAVTLTDGNYGEHGAPTDPFGLGGGTLVDADPRIISNLIVDQTLDNPAAIAAALRYAGHDPADMLNAVEAIRTVYLANKDVLQAAQEADAASDAAAAAAGAAFIAWQTAIGAGDPNAPVLWDAYQTAIGTAVISAQEAANAANAAATASATLTATLETYGIEMDANTIRLPNVSPDEGLSAPYNAWFTLFGQFFDHGLDLVAKGGNGTVYIPLQPDDPLYDPASPHTNFMVLTRASIGEDAGNVTTPWVDQNQTYTSHASHQVFLREYALNADGKPVATGHLLDGARGLATWGDIKAQAREMLGIELTDADVGMVPMLRTDPYGRFIPDPETGFAQVIVGLGADGIPNTADDIVVSGTPDSPVNPTTAGALRLPNAFLDDIAHAAVPIITDGVLQADDDSSVGYSGGFDTRGQQTGYDDELLDAHYITGDGRGNENIGLTAVHHVFHAEHNRQVDQIKQTILDSGDLAFLNEWLIDDVTSIPGSPDGLVWDGERLFQAARFSTEMQYQHLVFEEYARKIQPDVDLFMVQPDVELDPAIFAEFANVVYRFGHSMLNQSVDRINADGSRDDIDLFEAFLNPLAFGAVDAEGNVLVDHREAAAAIARGMSTQHANEIDEFVTDVLRNQLVGIPLDLAAINIARGRDTGMPTLNQARAQFMEMAGGDTLLKPYDSWTDFALNLKNPESIINFIAAYGTHASIEGAETLQEKRDAAWALVFGGENAPADRLDFLNGQGAYAGNLGGLNDVDLWIGGLAEKKMAFGGVLGSTFSFVFQLQMENLQDSDRFYYLSRAQGLNLLTELENNSLAKMVMRNTDLDGFALPADIFSTPDHMLYMDRNKQLQMTGLDDPIHDNPLLEAMSNLVERRDANGDGVAEYIRYNGLDHIVIQGTDGNDHIIAGGGDDTVWGGAGDDRIEAGYGVDAMNGGDGDDIITSSGTDIGAVSVLKGDAGNDVIVDGTGMSLIFGGDGKDYLSSGSDDGDILAGLGDDFAAGGDGINNIFGHAGDDWIEGGAGFDYIAGDNGELFFNSTVIGHDVLNGGQGDTDYDADSGDDIMFAGEGIQKNIGMWGHDWVIHQGQQTGADADMRVEIFTTLPLEVLRDRFSQVEGLSGWHHDDVLRGDDRTGTGPEGGTVVDPTPETGLRYNELNQAAIDRIAGLDQIITDDLMVDGEYWADGSWENGQTGTSEKIFVGGNILLGGGGSDTIEGRGGDDVIDGDRYLSVRIAGTAKDGSTFSVDRMDGPVTLNGVTKPLSAWMIEGAVNPGSLEIVREILDGGAADDIDTAVYWDVRENYEVTQNADGSFTVAHIDQTGGAIDPVTGRNRESDGVDRLYNIERVQFADGVFDIETLIPQPNSPATGAPVISDLTPTEGQQLAVNTGLIADGNGLGAFSYQWQVSSDGGATWSNIPAQAGGTSANFTPNDGILGFGGQVGSVLRVAVSFTDGAGNLETLTSAPTGVVGDDWNAIPFVGNTFNGTEGDDIANGTSGLFGAGANDTLNGNGGNDILNGAGGNDTINGGAGDDIIDGGAGNDTINQTSTHGRDMVNGDSGNDTYRLNGAAGSEIFRIYAMTSGQNANLAALLGTAFAATTEIVVTRTANGAETVVAELDNIEEIVVNTLNVTADDGGGLNQGTNAGDTIQVVGNFSATSLNYSTITIEGSEGDDVIDISALESAHRIVFRSNGGNDTIIGTLRDQDVVEMPGDYTQSTSDDKTRLETETGSVTFDALGSPEITTGPGTNDDDCNDDDDQGGDDDNGEPVTPPPSSAPGVITGTSTSDVLMGTAGADLIFGFAGTDYIVSGTAADIIRGDEGDDFIYAEDGRDIVFAGDGDDDVFGGADDDALYGEDGDDWIAGDGGNDMLDGGLGNDTVFGGDGDDMFIGRANDGDDFYDGGSGIDTLDLGSVGGGVRVDLGTGIGGRGSVTGVQTGTDTLYGIENVTTGSGNDTIIASTAVNVIDGGAGEDVFVFKSVAAANGDTIVGFETGDRIDLSGIDANTGIDGVQSFTLVSGQTNAPGQLGITHESREDGDYTVISGNTGGDDQPEFRIEIAGNHTLTNSDFNL